MAKENKVHYVCSHCSFSSSKWYGQCPECGEWNSFEEISNDVENSVSVKADLNAKTVPLASVSYDNNFRFKSGIDELDRVLGGGIVQSSAVLIGGEPGIGKSTLMIQLAASCSAKGKVVYVSGEESASQVKQRADRLGLNGNKIGILCETKLEKILGVLESEKPQVMIIDSLQTLVSSLAMSVAGSVTQMRNCSMELISAAKRLGTAVFFVAHVNKEGTIAGPKIVEHMVDTVVYFESAATGVRFLRSIKNRFGSVDEIGIFTMSEKGLEGVKDPTSFFISQREGKVIPPGIAYTAVVEGSRTFLVEIQALVVDAKTGYGRVYSDKIDSSRVQRIAAILEKHASVRLVDKDIYVNVAGGVKVNEVSSDLAIAVALWSAARETVIPSGMVSFGELSLAGEVRPVSFAEKRIKAAKEMGFSKVEIPYSMSIKTSMLVKPCKTVAEALKFKTNS